MKLENNIVKSKKALDDVCKELGVLDIKYFISPKRNSENVHISDYANHATIMLKNYQKFLNGDKSSTIKEIFV